MKEKFDAVIVGGGIGGLLLSLILVRNGRTVAVLERQENLTSHARGELIQPNGLRILQSLGLLEDLVKGPVHRARRFHFQRIGGKEMTRVDYECLPPPFNYTLITLPLHLLRLVLERLREFPSFNFFPGMEFQGSLPREGGLAGVRASGGGRDIEFRAPVIIGSDGSRSAVRGEWGIPSDLHLYREGYLTLVVSRPPDLSEDARYYVGRGQILGMFPVSEKELYLFYMIKAGHQGRMRCGPVGNFLDRLCGIDARLSLSLGSVESWDSVGFMPCARVQARSWTVDGGALMGDAAHAMNPHVAQGRNQAMEDAVSLGEVLEDCFMKGDFSKSALSGYEAARRPSVEVLQRMGDELTVLWNTAFPPLAWIRDRIFEGMERHPRVREKVVRTISGLEVRPLGMGDRLRVLLPRAEGFRILRGMPKR